MGGWGEVLKKEKEEQVDRPLFFLFSFQRGVFESLLMDG